MSAQRATNTEQDMATVTEIQDTRDAYDARMDPEAKLLCALLWLGEAPEGRIGQLIDFLHPADFRRPAHARLFTLIAEQAAAGEPVEPTIIAAKADAAGTEGRDGWPGGATPQQFILDIASLEARPLQAIYLAELTVGASYRRQFQAMATFLAQAGAEADEDDLFALMAEQGRRQRAAKTRRDRFRTQILGRSADEDQDTTDENEEK